MQNRVTDIDDDTYTLHYDYDANGNRTGVRTQYYEATPTGPVRRTYDTYNAYDKMNRQTVVNGDKDASGTVVYGKAGHAITYDYAGNRLKDTSIGKGIVLSGKYLVRENVATTEDYVYDAVGRLADVRRDGIVINSRRYDLAGRVAETGLMTRSTADGLAAAVDALGGSSETHIYAYNWIGQITSQQDNSYVKDRATGNNVRNIWFGEGYDPVGNLRDYTVSPIKGDNTVYTITYEFTNGYRETGNRHNRSNTNNISGYDVNGNRTTVTDTGTGNVVRQMAFDADGHVQSRFDFVDGKAVERFSLIVNGQVLGEEDKKSTTVLGSTYAGVTASSQVAPPAFYSVQGANESLQSIAQSIWGDSKLWYLIADANGIDGATKLAPGDQLRIPTRVNTVHNDYATFRPYDAAEALGNNAPAMPPPSQGGGCGAVGTLIMIVVAVVVTYITAGAASGAIYAAMAQGATLTAATAATAAGAASLAAGAAIGGAVGSIASQAVGIAIGAQQGFNWKGVAMSAISGAVTSGVGSFAASGATGSWGAALNGAEWTAVAARAAVSNVVTQGIGNLTGLQKGFSWASVAASYAGAAVGNEVTSKLQGSDIFSSLGRETAKVAVASASGFAAGLTTAVMRGGKIAVARIATDAFGNALGSSLAENMRPTAEAPQRTFADSIGKDPSWMQDWNAANAQSAPSPYAEIERTFWEDTHGDNLIVGLNDAGGSSSRKGQLSAEEIAIAAKYLNDTTDGNSSTSSPLTRKFRSATGLVPSPFVDGTRITSGPVSAVGGFDRYGNSTNGAQFDLGQSWVGDLVKAPLNFTTNTVELVGNNLNLSFTLPGDPSYIPFMQSMKLPYSTEVGSYAEFGIGLLAAGTTTWARAPEIAAGEIAGTRMSAGASSASIGNSGYRSIGEFSDVVTTKYQSLYDEGYTIASQNASQGLIANTARAIGSDTDAFARVGLRDWLRNVEGIDEGPGAIIQVNRRLYDPSGSGAYRVPDVYIPGSKTILDGSISFKTGSSPQVIDFEKFSGNAKTTIIAPSGLPWGSYGIR